MVFAPARASRALRGPSEVVGAPDLVAALVGVEVHVTEVRINKVQLAKPGSTNTGVSSAFQIVDADTQHSMGAGLWATHEGALACCKRKSWRVVSSQERAA